jgi:uncharacterized phage infection (PIP) family protein YhgE
VRKRENGDGSKENRELNDDVDELFKRPLAEFTVARNTLATRLKQSGRANDANLVKALVKPSISAWTVNQLYWNHRAAFDRLLAAGQRFREVQASGLTGKVADMRGSLDARREALSHLSELATSLLRDAGHNPTPDTIRRITTTLEAISAHASLAGGPTPGRLSQDVDPPGFESLASFIPDTRTMKARVTASQKPNKATTAREVRQFEESRQTRIAAAKISLQAAKKSLAEARDTAQSLEAAQKKADADARQAEKQLREAEERFKKASAASEAAAKRSQSIAAEAEEATKAVEDARRTVEKASEELESLFSQRPEK